MIELKQIKLDVAKTGHITNSYLIYDTEKKNGVLIDPGYDEKLLINTIDGLGLTIKYIVITHAHGDHMGALEKVRNHYNSQVVINKYDMDALLNIEENYAEFVGVNKQYIDEKYIKTVTDGEILEDGDINLEIIHTPGHTKGCICIYEKNLNVLLTGDTLFFNCYGRCDLNGGSFEDMVTSLKKLYSRFKDIKIYPGHDKVVNIDDTAKRIRLLVAINGGEI